MKSFIDEMSSFKRQESKDPFCDPNISNAFFLRTIYHTLQKAPAERLVEIHMGIFIYVGGCIRAAESGMPLPNFSQYEPPQGSYRQYPSGPAISTTLSTDPFAFIQLNTQ